MHRGSIDAASKGKGMGSTFTLRLAVVDEARRAAAANLPADAPRAGLRILLVEDHADTRRVLGRLLNALGCQVTSAGTVKEALELGEKVEFDLLVSDIGLPDGTGTEVMLG